VSRRVAIVAALAALAGAALAGSAPAGAAQAQTVTLKGPGGETRVVTAADLAAMPHDHASIVNEHGPAKTYDGVPLTLLLQSVGAPSGPKLRGPAMADIVVVSGSDGYRVALALAETDPGLGGRTILLADKVDGVPLPATEGPFRLIVAGDARPARSVRMVAAVMVEAAP
jgi:hypothetical protein